MAGREAVRTSHPCRKIRYAQSGWHPDSVALRRTFRRRAVPIGPAVAVGAVLSVVLAAITSFIMNSDWWGALGQWAGAVGTIAAVAAALHIANREARTAEARQRLEVEQREARELASAHQREIETASLVIIETEYIDETQFSGHLSSDDAPDVGIRITNHSSEPILLPRLELLRHPLGGESRWKVWVDPTGLNEGWGAKSVLPPGETESFYADVTYEPPLAPGERWKHDLQPVFGFTDKAGRRWRRHGNDLPYQVFPGDSEPISGDEWYQVRQQ